MEAYTVEMAGIRVFVCAADGPQIAAERDATDLIGEAFGADLVAIPRQRLTADFFALKTGLAGAILQKLVNYRLRVAILGDVSAEVAASNPLRDFVRESNRGRHVWFVDDLAALEAKLSG